jgi:hypothetical protein
MRALPLQLTASSGPEIVTWLLAVAQASVPLVPARAAVCVFAAREGMMIVSHR